MRGTEKLGQMFRGWASQAGLQGVAKAERDNWVVHDTGAWKGLLGRGAQLALPACMWDCNSKNHGLEYGPDLYQGPVHTPSIAWHVEVPSAFSPYPLLLPLP